MQVATHVQDAVLGEAVNQYIERRLRFALGRFGSRVGQTRVRITAEGDRGRRCRISVEVLPFGRVAVEEIDTDLFAAIDRATGKVGRLVGRELERMRSLRNDRASVRLAA